MPQCKECGFISSRLQWTHFKYKCTGKYQNGTEYIKDYPSEILVDPALAKKTSITLANLITKYGEIDGIRRWDSYKNKQSVTNSYEYKKEKYGWSTTDFDDFNKSRSVTLYNMIKKHGEDAGIIKWEQYCDRQRYTKSIEYLVEKYGEIDGHVKYKEIIHKKTIARDNEFQLFSNSEKEFILLVESQLGKLENTSLSDPYCAWTSENSFFIYDIKHKDCIIEFNGDYWHANPDIFSSSDKIKNKTAQEIWDKDKMKLELAKTLGFRVLVVWESAYYENKSETIEGVIKWILNEQE